MFQFKIQAAFIQKYLLMKNINQYKRLISDKTDISIGQLIVFFQNLSQQNKQPISQQVIFRRNTYKKLLQG